MQSVVFELITLLVFCLVNQFISFKRLPDIPYSWSCYDTVEEVQLLFECLSHQGIRESALKKALKEQTESITEGIRRFAEMYSTIRR